MRCDGRDRFRTLHASVPSASPRPALAQKTAAGAPASTAPMHAAIAVHLLGGTCSEERDQESAMALARVHSRGLRGLEAPAVTVEAPLANGLPSFTLVGLADTEVRESRERVRAALQTSGLGFPLNKRVTVSLALADLPKESGRFHLPIALGILAAAGQIDASALDRFEFAGELSLGGELRPMHGALAMALALRRAPEGVPRMLVLPPGPPS
jgi:hypothetical protein